MSILIKGMEMPTNCRDCPLKMNCDDCEGWECVCVPSHHQIGYLDELLSDKRRDDCQLIEIPPHGRLIDADAFTKDECNYCDGACEALPCDCLNCKSDCRCDFMKDIADAPTIIPAEPCNDLAKPNNAPTVIEAEEGE